MTTAEEKKRLQSSILIPGILLVLMWLVKFTEFTFHTRFSFLGITPLEPIGLLGIFLSPFLHGDWNHLMANSVPVFVLGSALYYFYRPIATKVLLLTVLMTGLWVWVGARESTHIGASGVIYGLSSFLMFSGFLRRDNRLMALSFVVVFLYGSLVWGIFPELFPEKNISWESHLSGLVAGIILAAFFRKEGPQRRLYSWDLEPEPEQSEEVIEEEKTEVPAQKPYWDIPQPDKDDLTVVYRTRRKS